MASDADAAGHTTPQATLIVEHSLEIPAQSTSPSCFYTSATWSADGTCIIATTSDYTVSSFVLPTDLLDDDNTVKALQPNATTRLPEATQAISIAPYFSLSEPASQLFLAGCRDHPLQLYNAFPPAEAETNTPICTYKLIRKETEEYIAPTSLLWEQSGTHFICGSSNRLDYFDLSRPGSDGPILTIPTIPSKRHVLKGGGVGMKGIVSSLSAGPLGSSYDSLVAAGTWTRWMGLYDLQRSNKATANWSVADAEQAEFQLDLGGQGIAQTLWSPCGRYLVINERRASGLLVYDVRGTGKLLSVLTGRPALTQQRLGCDTFQVMPAQDGAGGVGFEVWAGSHNGQVVVWRDVGLHYGAVDPAWSWQAHASPTGSTALHPSGSVAATCSGGWQHVSDEGIVGRSIPDPQGNLDILPESTVKIWTIDESSTS